MSTTVSDLIKSSMRKLGVLASGEPLPSDEGQDAFDTFRDMVGAWANESLLIPVVSVISFPLIDGVSSYTIGKLDTIPLPENHIDSARPQEILAAAIVDSSGTTYPIKQFEVKAFSELNVSQTISTSTRFYIREGWPVNTIEFDSVPYSTSTLKMEVLLPFSEFLSTASLTDVVNLPPGYNRALIYNLAIDLADEWGKDITSSIAVNASTSKQWLKRNNYRSLKLTSDPAITALNKRPRTYNINEGP